MLATDKEVGSQEGIHYTNIGKKACMQLASS